MKKLETGWLCDVTTKEGIIELAQRHRAAADRMVERNGQLLQSLVHSELFGLLPDRLTARMPPAKCVCGSEVDAATSLGHRSKPKPGDFSVCIVCARLLMFEPDYSLREIDPSELGLLDTETRNRLIAAQGAIRQERLPGKPGQRGLA